MTSSVPLGALVVIYMLPLLLITILIRSQSGCIVMLALFTLTGVGGALWIPSLWPALIYFMILGLLIFFGALRVSCWEADQQGKTPPKVEKIVIAPTIVFTTASLWFLIAPVGMTSWQPPYSFANILTDIMTIVFLFTLWYQIIFVMIAYLISPLLSFTEVKRTAKLEDYFVAQGSVRSRATWHCIKFEDDPIIWMVSGMQFKSYVEKLGSLYEYTSTTGLFGRRYMREKPVLIQYAGDVAVDHNDPRHSATPNMRDYKRLPYIFALLAGLLLIISAACIGIMLIIGWQNRPDLHDTIVKEAGIPVIVLGAGILLSMFAIRRMSAISHAKQDFGAACQPESRQNAKTTD